VLKVHPDALHMEHENPYTKRHHSSRIWKEEARSKFSHSSSPQMFSNIRNSKHMIMSRIMMIIIAMYIKKIYLVALIITTMIHSHSKNKGKVRSNEKRWEIA
jgi:hypothetical protein